MRYQRKRKKERKKGERKGENHIQQAATKHGVKRRENDIEAFKYLFYK